MSEICEYKGRPCYGRMPTSEGRKTTWSIIERLSIQGEGNSKINTSELPAKDVFRQSPVELAELYSDMGVAHSCHRCTELIAGVVVTLGLKKPKT